MLSTANKIRLARWVSRFVIGLRSLMGLGSKLTATRSRVLWQLDLHEGIDFSIWLLGGFEPRTLKQYETLVAPGNTVVDIGANVGAHTLPFARLVGPVGRVVAFEPTKWAFEKLQNNLELNPAISGRVECIQALLVAERGDSLLDQIYSSWPLEEQKGLHQQHKGRLMTTAGASVLTLTDAITNLGLNRVDFIKIDVDGHEYAVIRGGLDILKKFRPRILMELAPYVYDPSDGEFDALLELMTKIGYRPFHTTTKKALPVNPAEMKQLIPEGGSINVLFIPQ
jgi:FkbM family methyltransferase